MNGKLMLRLSLAGLLMALAGVFFIPHYLDSLCWLAIYLCWAYTIAKHCRLKRFFNGLLLGCLSGVWVTGVDVLLIDRYLAHHPRAVAVIEMLYLVHVTGSPRRILTVAGLATGVAVGVLVGVFAVIAGLMRKPRHLDATYGIHP